MPRRGRDLEQTVASIEKALGGAIEVKSPYFINDKDTNQTREIDIALIATIGTASILIIVECRDRSDAEDVRWIEQLQSKKDSVRASKAIAVTSAGFTEPAKMKAKALGIELRQTRELTPDAIRGWFGDFTIELSMNRSQLLGMRVLFLDPHGTLTSDPRLQATSSMPINKIKLTHVSTRETLNPMQLWKIISRDHVVWATVPEDGTHIRAIAPATFNDEKNRYCISLEAGLDAPIVGIRFEVECWKEVTVQPFLKCVTYSATSGSSTSGLGAALETEVNLEGIPSKAMIVFDASHTAKGLMFWPQRPADNAPCPCASGETYGRCHGANAQS